MTHVCNKLIQGAQSFASYMRRSAKMFPLSSEEIIENISYKRHAYESVDDWEPILDWISKRDKRKQAFRG